MTQDDLSKAKDPDLRGSLPAMRRAAAMARCIAIQTGTEIVVVRDGKPVRISAAQLREGQGMTSRRPTVDRGFREDER